MAYKFGTDESVRHALRRCGREQLDRAILELSEGIVTDPVSAIHSARKAIKKERSLLRLARDAMPREQRRHDNAALRETARGLSSARDADVMIASVDELSKRYAGQLPAADFETVRAYLEARRSSDHGHRTDSTGNEDAVGQLSALRTRADDWRLRRRGWKSLEGGLLRSYGRGRQAFARAHDTSEMEDLHAWRKRVKDLWYHERLLAPTCGPTVGGHSKELDQLSDLLGDDHDLAVLRRELAQEDTPAAADLDGVVKLIDYRRAELQTEAFHMGERIYAETPKAFRRRLRRSWKAGRALARAPRARDPLRLGAATR